MSSIEIKHQTAEFLDKLNGFGLDQMSSGHTRRYTVHIKSEHELSFYAEEVADIYKLTEGFRQFINKSSLMRIKYSFEQYNMGMKDQDTLPNISYKIETDACNLMHTKEVHEGRNY